MLVLTRKQQDQIQIGDNVRITVLKIKGQSVRIGIEAPRDVRVVRGELTFFEDEPVSDPPRPSLVFDASGETSPSATPVLGTAGALQGGVRHSRPASHPSTLQTLVSRQRLKKRVAANVAPHSFE